MSPTAAPKLAPAALAEPEVHYAMGWLPDYPDFRDFHAETTEGKVIHGGAKPIESVKSMLGRLKLAEIPKTLPASVDLRAWCSPIENQLNLGSCTAQAGAGVVEYFERRAFNKHIDASRLFLYKTTRDLLHWTGDTGAFCRTTMASLVLFGVPPEEYWPYNPANFDTEPPSFCYAFGQNYQAISYYRLDPPGTTPQNLLQRIKTYLAGYLPSFFGFTVYDC